MIAPIGCAELYVRADDQVNTMKMTFAVATAVLLLLWPAAAADPLDAVDGCNGQPWLDCMIQSVFDFCNEATRHCPDSIDDVIETVSDLCDATICGDQG